MNIELSSLHIKGGQRSAFGAQRILQITKVCLIGAILIAFWIPLLVLGEEPKPAALTTKGGVEMLLVPAGSFTMGDEKGAPDQKPAHIVKLLAFYMDKYLVTQQECRRLTGSTFAKWSGDNNPCDNARWSDAVHYCNARSREDGLGECYDPGTLACDFSKDGYRLPTEAEWEYACRAGTQTAWFFGDNGQNLQVYAWYERNSGKRPRPVGRKLANPWGFYDLLGNVWEWCSDYYGAGYYAIGPRENPTGPAKGTTRVVRGGAWNSNADECRSACRGKAEPGADACFQFDVYGFRCVRRAPAP